MNSQETDEPESEDETKDEDCEVPHKKRKLANGKAMDQFSHEFAIKVWKRDWVWGAESEVETRERVRGNLGSI